jgi:tetratricopeptide (TPR) repeat protein
MATASARPKIGMVSLGCAKNLVDAEIMFRRALEICKANYGADHPKVASPLSNLAMLLHATDRSVEAEPMIQRALMIDEASYGPDHPEVATRLNNLAVLLQDTNRAGEAERLYRRAAIILLRASKASGHRLPNTVDSLSNWAVTLTALGQTAEQAFSIISSHLAEEGLDPSN